MTEEVVDLVKPYHDRGEVVCFGCNDTYKIVPYLDEHYACDGKWYKHWLEDLREKLPNARKWTQEQYIANDNEDINFAPGTWNDDAGLSLDPTIIHYGANSGFQAG